MKKMLLLLVCLTTFAWLHADEAPVYTYQFGPKLNTASTQGYTASAKFTVVNNDIPMQFVAFNNNNTSQSGKGTWTYIRCGGSKNTNGVTATATNQIAMPKAIGKIVINAQRYKSGTNDKATSAKLLVSANNDFSNAKSYDLDFNSLTTTATDITVNIDNPAIDLFYQINIVLPKCDNNGWLQFNEISFYEAIITPTNQVATPKFDPATETAVEAGDKVTISCDTDGASIYYTTDETDPTESSTLYDASTGIIVNEAMTIKAIAVKEGLENSEIASATYTIKKPVVATPTFDPESGEVEKGRTIYIFCETVGAKIYYTTDNTTPNVESTLYEAGVIVDKAMTIKAIAVAEGYNDSEVATVTYSIKGEAPANPSATFDFTQPSTLQPALIPPTTTSPSDAQRVKLDNYVFYNNYTLVKFASPVGAQGQNWSQLWNGSDGPQVRVYTNSKITITAAENLTIEKVEFISAGSSYIKIKYNGTLGSYSVSGATGTWTRGAVNALAAEDRESITFDVTGTSRLNSINVYTNGVPTGVEDVTVDENAPVEYYNLQGVRVANPENGIYIRRQGSKVSKVLVK